MDSFLKRKTIIKYVLGTPDFLNFLKKGGGEGPFIYVLFDVKREFLELAKLL